MATALYYLYLAGFLSSAFCASLGNNSYGDHFYVSSERMGCVTVTSQEPCPATTLNPDIAVAYKYDVDSIESLLEETKANNASDECLSALTTTLCSKLTARCFVNGSKDYGDARVACRKANKTCPSDSLEEGECESLKTGLHHLSACVKPLKPINGSCPQPKYKMPADKLDLYKRSSEEYAKISYFKPLTTATYKDGSRMFSDECVSNITELYCLPFYCSADEQLIIVEYTYEECEEIFHDCFEPIIDQLAGEEKEDIIELRERYEDNCFFYPDAVQPPPENTTTSTPSTHVSSATPAEKGSFPSPGQNTSTTPPEKMESSPAPRDTKQPPSERTTLILLTPSPTAGNARCHYFPSLLLFLLIVVVKIC